MYVIDSDSAVYGHGHCYESKRGWFYVYKESDKLMNETNDDDDDGGSVCVCIYIYIYLCVYMHVCSVCVYVCICVYVCRCVVLRLSDAD